MHSQLSLTEERKLGLAVAEEREMTTPEIPEGFIDRLAVHVRELGTPVSIFGMTVEHGDSIHADRHGALVIPPEVISSLKSAIATLQTNESLIRGPAREPGFNIEKLETAWSAFERARI